MTPTDPDPVPAWRRSTTIAVVYVPAMRRAAAALTAPLAPGLPRRIVQSVRYARWALTAAP